MAAFTVIPVYWPVIIILLQYAPWPLELSLPLDYSYTAPCIALVPELSFCEPKKQTIKECYVSVMLQNYNEFMWKNLEIIGGTGEAVSLSLFSLGLDSPNSFIRIKTHFIQVINLKYFTLLYFNRKIAFPGP